MKRILILTEYVILCPCRGSLTSWWMCYVIQHTSINPHCPSSTETLANGMRVTASLRLHESLFQTHVEVVCGPDINADIRSMQRENFHRKKLHTKCTSANSALLNLSIFLTLYLLPVLLVESGKRSSQST